MKNPFKKPQPAPSVATGQNADWRPVIWTADKLPKGVPVERQLGTPEKLVLRAKEVYDARVNHGISADQSNPLILVFTPASYNLVEDMTALQVLLHFGESRNVRIAVEA